MGAIGTVLDVEPNSSDGEIVTDVKIELGDDLPVSSPIMGPAGIEALPLPEDYVAAVEHPGSSGFTAVGFADDSVETPVGNGEVYIFGRDSGHTIKCSVWLKSNGEIQIQNDSVNITFDATGNIALDNSSGKIELKSTGQVAINNVFTVDP